ncbi:wax ester/triacylglycerol synthase family O-acyltransferase [Nocardia sp. 348MFTsu5.1]|uniref:WS/DGAT/MGAT family O-acyltransferase n=1 Tax=Nocardia sp. 348MFTsu5.1 TaxID=1172185 RepID=UPI000379B07D|nr:wax ester/triacylglycerol synthase family O-acyltransferase [Nocardia sp. 348MFTsu5.1]
MERMEGVDAGYLYMETPTMHMHTLKIAIMERSDNYTFEGLQQQLLSRMNDLPPLKRRPLPVPFALNHPLWISDGPIDPLRHIFRHDLPAPGGHAELEAIIGQVGSTPLDRTIPLWEVHVCEGMNDGSVAVIGKLHHALADGGAANALIANITDSDDAEIIEHHEKARPADWQFDVVPTKATQVKLALQEATLQLGTIHTLLGRTSSGAVAALKQRRRHDVSVPRPILDAPRTSFNGALTSRRNFATCTLDLDHIKQVRQTNDVTVNDVVLAVVAGALRTWTDARGEHPEGALLAGVPVSTEEMGAGPRLSGNRVSNLFTTLATDVDDPIERLQTISRTTSASKDIQRSLGPSMLADWVQFTPPAPFSAFLRWYSRSRMASRHPPPFNVIVSNVKGPPTEVRIAGSRLQDLYSVGPIIEGIGLNITAWSYAGRLNIAALSCPDLLPDLRSLVAGLEPALEQLLETVTPSPKGDERR